MRYIGIYEHRRKTLKTWDVEWTEDLKFETFVIMTVPRYRDQDRHRDVITVADKTTRSRFTDTHTFSIGVFLKLLLQSFQGKGTELLHANDCHVLVGF